MSRQPPLAKKFVSDMGIYAIGNIGSKLITFMMVSFYSYFITDPAEFGYYDICFTVAFMMYPFLSFEMAEGGFRFMIESGDESLKRSVISSVYTNLIRNILVLVCIAIAVGYTFSIRYLALTVMFGIAQSTFDTTLQLVRGLGRTKVFAAAGIINASAIAVFSIITVALLRWGVTGIFLANIFARFTSIAFMQFRIRLWPKYISYRFINRQTTRMLLHYSLPLIPTAIFWLALNGNNVFFIRHFLGLEDNGIFSIIIRFSGILVILTNIFYQTWQQNAIEQYNSPDRDKLFSSIFRHFLYGLFFLASLFAVGLRANMFWLVSAEYQSAGPYFYSVAIWVIFLALFQFFELGYQCSRHTARLIPNIILGASINIAGNWLLIPILGLYGAIISNIATYFILAVYRWIDTAKYMTIHLSPHSLVPLALFIITGVYFYSPLTGFVPDIIFIAVISALYLFFAPKAILKRILR